MTSFAAIAAGLAGLILLAGAPPYLYDIIKGKTKPQRTTWLIWSVLGVIAFGSQLSLDGGWSLWFVGLDALGSIVVFLLALKYGVGGWTKLDKTAMAIAIVGVGLSLIIKQPIVALLGVIAADMSGAVLTIRKAYYDPGSETAITWFFIGTAALLGAISVGKLDVGLLLYPAYLAVANYGVLMAQAFGKRRLAVK